MCCSNETSPRLDRSALQSPSASTRPWRHNFWSLPKLKKSGKHFVNYLLEEQPKTCGKEHSCSHGVMQHKKIQRAGDRHFGGRFQKWSLRSPGPANWLAEVTQTPPPSPQPESWQKSVYKSDTLYSRCEGTHPAPKNASWVCLSCWVPGEPWRAWPMGIERSPHPVGGSRGMCWFACKSRTT